MASEAPQKSQEGAQGSLRKNKQALTRDWGIFYWDQEK